MCHLANLDELSDVSAVELGGDETRADLVSVLRGLIELYGLSAFTAAVKELE